VTLSEQLPVLPRGGQRRCFQDAIAQIGRRTRLAQKSRLHFMPSLYQSATQMQHNLKLVGAARGKHLETTEMNRVAVFKVVDAEKSWM